MLNNINKFWRNPKTRQSLDPKNLPVYLFTLVVLAIAWSGVKTIQDNYQLQKKISVLKQQNAVLQLQNDNAKLQNQYYNTNQYLDLAARQALGLASPGEKVLLIPKATALKYVDQTLAANSSSNGNTTTQSRYVKNIEAWRDFLLGRKTILSN